MELKDLVCPWSSVNPTEADRGGEAALKIAQEMGWQAGEAVALMMLGVLSLFWFSRLP